MNQAYSLVAIALVSPHALARSPSPMSPPSPQGLEIFQAGYPRAVFLQPVGLTTPAWHDQNTIVWWGCEPTQGYYEAVFRPTLSRLNGIANWAMVEQNEAGGPSRPILAMFKGDFPTQLVLPNVSTVWRSPNYHHDTLDLQCVPILPLEEDGTAGLTANHWLYLQGCSVNPGMDAAATSVDVGPTNIHLFEEDLDEDDPVDTPYVFGDELLLCSMNGGLPDFTNAEFARITDRVQNTLYLERGIAGSSAKDFSGGVMYLAPVANFETGAPLKWNLNLSTACPTLPTNSKRAWEIVADQFEGWFAPNGPLDGFDGLYAETGSLFGDRFVNLGDRGGTGDHDGDALGEGGFIGGRNTFANGQFLLHKELRTRLDPDLLIASSASGVPDTQRSFLWLDGCHYEFFPDLSCAFDGWSTGLNNLAFYDSRTSDKKFDLVTLRTCPNAGAGGPHLNRLAMALGTMSESIIGFSAENVFQVEIEEPPSCPQDPLDINFPIPDEIRGGCLQQKNWLGMPMGPMVRPGLDAPDLLGGIGAPPSLPLLAHFTSSEATISLVQLGFGASNRALQFVPVIPAPIDSPAGWSASFEDLDELLPIEDDDLLVSFEIRGQLIPDADGIAMPRVLGIHLGQSSSVEPLYTFFDGQWFSASFYWRGPSQSELEFEFERLGWVQLRNFEVRAAADVALREYENGLILANPSDEPYSFAAEIAQLGWSPGFSRIAGYMTPDVNDGSSFTSPSPQSVPARDALFLLRN